MSHVSVKPGQDQTRAAVWLVIALAAMFLLVGCIPDGPRLFVTPSPTATRRTTSEPTPAMVLHRQLTTPTPSPTPCPVFCVVSGTAGKVLNVRAAPNLAAAILGGLTPGQRVKVESWGVQWHKIDSGQLSGYVYALYCKE